MKCQVISIGNELLNGDTVNTNASWLGRYLTELGVDVTGVHTIGDDHGLIMASIRQSLEQSDLVITTGGLGPTHDDVTKKAVQELFGASLVVHEPTLNFIREVFKKRNIPFSKSNYHQAEVPDNCEVLFNKRGTAPGMWFEQAGSRLAVLPGVPSEMKELFKQYLTVKIEDLTGGREQIFSRYLVTAGIGESTLSDNVVGDLSAFLNDDVSVAYLPGPQGVRIRISGRGESKEEAMEKIAPLADHFYLRAGDYVVGEGKELTLGEAVSQVLRNRRLTIATGESCTGGMLSDQLTNVPGSSDYMLGGIIAYANNTKVDLLGVSSKDLAVHGAVSKTVALQMARGVAQRIGSDIGISITGIAGPGGGTVEKPVGTVWIGYWSQELHFALNTVFTNDRLTNKERSTAVALETIRRTVQGINTLPYDLKPHFA
jgi:nicotinamide-nucleotide amidase